MILIPCDKRILVAVQVPHLPYFYSSTMLAAFGVFFMAAAEVQHVNNSRHSASEEVFRCETQVTNRPRVMNVKAC